LHVTNERDELRSPHQRATTGDLVDLRVFPKLNIGSSNPFTRFHLFS
jgi:hypothetical protein